MKKQQGFMINGRPVGENHPVFIIAEVGVNHNGSVVMAKKLIDVAVAARADGVKFQMCDPDEMVTKEAPKAEYQKRNKAAESQYDMLKRLYFGVPEHKELKAYAKKKGIILFSTPFSIKDVRELIKLKMPAMKVGSSDTNNIPQLRVIAHSRLPIILSTGMSTLAEVKQSVKEIYKTGNKKIVVLHCTTQYPAEDKNINLRAMLTMRRELGVPIGYSDHTPGVEVSLAAVALGACVIEKHITLDKKLPGPDHFASLEPRELSRLVQGIRRIEKALGSDKKMLTPAEKIIARVARKSIVAARDIPKGKKITEADLAFKRPGTGLLPKHADEIIGKIAQRAVPRDTPLQWNMLV
jgi:N-acetylneuraminate synthase